MLETLFNGVSCVSRLRMSTEASRATPAIGSSRVEVENVTMDFVTTCHGHREGMMWYG